MRNQVCLRLFTVCVMPFMPSLTLIDHLGTTFSYSSNSFIFSFKFIVAIIDHRIYSFKIYNYSVSKKLKSQRRVFCTYSSACKKSVVRFPRFKLFGHNE